MIELVFFFFGISVCQKAHERPFYKGQNLNSKIITYTESISLSFNVRGGCTWVSPVGCVAHVGSSPQAGHNVKAHLMSLSLESSSQPMSLQVNLMRLDIRVCLDWTYCCWNWKLKTENWKHCSKIIFKCVNSNVRPIFNIF